MVWLLGKDIAGLTDKVNANNLGFSDPTLFMCFKACRQDCSQIRQHKNT